MCSLIARSIEVIQFTHFKILALLWFMPSSHEVKEATIIFVLLRLICSIIIRCCSISSNCKWITVWIKLTELISTKLLRIIAFGYVIVCVVIYSTWEIAKDIVARVNSWISKIKTTIIIICFCVIIGRLNWITCSKSVAKVSEWIAIFFWLFNFSLWLLLLHLSKWISCCSLSRLWRCCNWFWWFVLEIELCE